MKKKITTTTEEFDEAGILISRETKVTEELPAVSAATITGGTINIPGGNYHFDIEKNKEPRFRIEGAYLYYGDTKIGEIIDAKINWMVGEAVTATTKLQLNPSIEWDDE